MRADVVELLGVDRPPEQLAELRATRAARRSPAACRRPRGGPGRRACRARLSVDGEVEHVVDDLEAHAEVASEPGERVEGADRRRRTPCRRCDTTSRTARRSCPRSPTRSPSSRAVGVEEVLELEDLARGTARRWSPRAARRRRRRATRRATTRGRAGSRRRGSRRCCSSGRSRSGTPRRVSASSITSSW